MTPDVHPDNQLHLSAAVRRVREAVERYAERVEASAPEAGPSAGDRAAPEIPRPAGGRPPRLDTLVDAFGLSPFERDVLLLCAGMELDTQLTGLVQRLSPAAGQAAVTFSLALAALPDAHWSALSPEAPLRYWRLIEVERAASLTLAPLRIDERILQFLTGIACMDERLAALVRPAPLDRGLPPSHAAIARRVAAAWSSDGVGPQLPLIQLCGSGSGAKIAIAAAACDAVGLELWILPHKSLPPSAHELDGLRRLWEREFVLAMRALLIEWEEPEGGAAEAQGAASFVERLDAAVIVSAPHRGHWTRAVAPFDVERPPAVEQKGCWLQALGPAADGAANCAGRLAYQFTLDTHTIASIGAEAARSGGPLYLPGLWDACRRAARPPLGLGVERIESSANWDRLVLPQRQLDLLREIVLQVAGRAEVYGNWGFEESGQRGLGIAALFAGQSGTGKTFAAEVLAAELKLDLYRIDLSAVVNKYVGETEKNLRRVFDTAEAGGAILLFDEADALFGKRSEVKDSHDRYSNIEVSYLLQRMEAYRGLAILTTNLKENLDQAFLRRLRFVIHFPFPDAALRAQLWQRVFPARTPVLGLDVDKLSRLNATGAEIHNIALSAAFLATGEGGPVTMKHLRRAAITEFAKAERSLPEAETRGWE